MARISLARVYKTRRVMVGETRMRLVWVLGVTGVVVAQAGDVCACPPAASLLNQLRVKAMGAEVDKDMYRIRAIKVPAGGFNITVEGGGGHGLVIPEDRLNQLKSTLDSIRQYTVERPRKRSKQAAQDASDETPPDPTLSNVPQRRSGEDSGVLIDMASQFLIKTNEVLDIQNSTAVLEYRGNKTEIRLALRSTNAKGRRSQTRYRTVFKTPLDHVRLIETVLQGNRFLVDLKNGTMVDGKPVTLRLAKGIKRHAGKVIFMYREEAEDKNKNEVKSKSENKSKGKSEGKNKDKGKSKKMRFVGMEHVELDMKERKLKFVPKKRGFRGLVSKIIRPLEMTPTLKWAPDQENPDYLTLLHTLYLAGRLPNLKVKG